MRTLLSTLIASCGLLLSGPALAASLYVDAYTANLFGDFHGRATLATDAGSLSELLAGTDFDLLGDGLGAGLVTTSTPLTVTHVFSPSLAVGSIESASLTVSVIDDLDLLSTEEVAISVGGSTIDGGSGSVLAGLFGGDVTAVITSVGDALDVTITAVKGDFKVGFSALVVKFDGGAVPGGPSIPEPSAALVFAAGLLVVARRRS
jgi:hypothetical protein